MDSDMTSLTGSLTRVFHSDASDSCNSSEQNSDGAEEFTPTIAIIGAGVAGLRASQVLLEKGYNVKIYEARDRIGGRICTSNILGKAVDMGPNWIHGTTNNPIIPLSQLSSSTLHNYSDVCPIFTPSGDLLDQTESDELQNLLWKVIDRAVEFSKSCHSVIPAEKSFYDYCVEKAEELFGSGSDVEDDCIKEKNGDCSGSGKGGVKRSSKEHIRWKGEEERRKDIWLAMAEMWGTFIGSSVRTQSLKFFFLEEPLEGPNIFVASTYRPMVDTLAKAALAADIIKLNTPVDEITTITEDGRKRVLLKFSEAPEENCEVDGVIVTVPLGCLKHNQIKFKPELPERFQHAINDLSYGSLEKVYIKFPRAFWGLKGPDLATFLAPNYASKTNPDGWHMCCFSLAHLPEPCAQPTLLFYTFGLASAHLTSNFPPTTSRAGKIQYINFFKPYFSKLSGYNEHDVDCMPTEIIVTAWGKDKWAGYGSYASFQVGLTRGEEDIEILKKGCGERRLWFGGEHTGPVLGLGSVSGAYWSGEDVAGHVITEFESIPDTSINGTSIEQTQMAYEDCGTANGYGKKTLEINGKVVDPIRFRFAGGEGGLDFKGEEPLP